MKQYIVDAFTAVPFAGNPAAVCVMETWPSETAMKKLAMENSLSETAYLVPEGDGYRLRWFTPKAEVELCGHATLASSFVIMNHIRPGSREVTFHTVSDDLHVVKEENRYVMDLPRYPLHEIPVSDEMEAAFGYRPVKAILGLDLICVFENEEQVRSMNPDQKLLAGLPGRRQNATARGRETDCVSRSFCPELAVPEDPVCGSAHCQIADYWAKVLNRQVIEAYQASARGGYLHCEIRENSRIAISGEAVLVAVSEVLAPMTEE